MHVLTVDAKLSSSIGPVSGHSFILSKIINPPSNIILAASLDTSEPEIFMAIPRSAYSS